MKYTIAKELPENAALILGVARREILPHWADGVELELAYVDGTDDTFIWVNRLEDGTITAAYPGVDFDADGKRVTDKDTENLVVIGLKAALDARNIRARELTEELDRELLGIDRLKDDLKAATARYLEG